MYRSTRSKAEENFRAMPRASHYGPPTGKAWPRMLLRSAVAALALFVLTGAPAARAQQVDRIAAVVNDEIISVQDLDQRIRLAVVLSGLEDSPDVRKRVIPQVIRKMVDERLQMQEAARVKISIGAAEVETGLAAIEQQSGLPRGGLLAQLKRAGIDPAVVRDQMKADLTWMRVSARAAGPAVRVGEEEVNDRLEMLAARQGKPEYLAAEIMLSVDTPDQDEEMRNLGERLLQQLRSGAPFQALARQFSRSPTAANGGSMGWVAEDMLDEELSQALSGMKPGDLSGLIKTSSGYSILSLVNRRIAGAQSDPDQAVVTVASLVFPVPANGPPKDQLAVKAAQIVEGAKNCEGLAAVGRKIGSEMDRQKPMQVAALPQQIRSAVGRLPVGRPSQPQSVPEGLVIHMVCDRDEAPAALAALPSKETVRRMIEDERQDMLARRYLRDLRRAAFVEIRI